FHWSGSSRRGGCHQWSRVVLGVLLRRRRGEFVDVRLRKRLSFSPVVVERRGLLGQPLVPSLDRLPLELFENRLELSAETAPVIRCPRRQPIAHTPVYSNGGDRHGGSIRVWHICAGTYHCPDA